VAEEAVVVPQPQQQVQLQPAEAAGGAAAAGGRFLPDNMKSMYVIVFKAKILLLGSKNRFI
jgi:hypothetical protein